MGPANTTPDGTPLPMTLEARPGGRWFRDLGQDDGHFWGHVQAIKRPTLLEITGPLFMSLPVASNVQYRLKAAGNGTVICSCHAAFGVVPDEFREGLGAAVRACPRPGRADHVESLTGRPPRLDAARQVDVARPAGAAPVPAIYGPGADENPFAVVKATAASVESPEVAQRSRRRG